jgi:hypothetical protein
LTSRYLISGVDSSAAACRYKRDSSRNIANVLDMETPLPDAARADDIPIRVARRLETFTNGQCFEAHARACAAGNNRATDLLSKERLCRCFVTRCYERTDGSAALRRKSLLQLSVFWTLLCTNFVGVALHKPAVGFVGHPAVPLAKPSRVTGVNCSYGPS